MSIIHVTREVDLETIECPGCTGLYAISKRYREEALRLGKFMHCWTCPYCKTERGYGEGEADKLRNQLGETERRLTAAKCETANERAARELAERKLKNQTRRVKCGVCPCCKRTFRQLASHMRAKHPDFPVEGKKK